jgi:hypothetical protein
MAKGTLMKILDLAQGVRRNHALEHATIHVLSARFPHMSLMGRSGVTGFWIYGPLPTEEVERSAKEALARLQGGEAHLAVHPRCGTNLAVTSVMAGTAAFGATLGTPRSKLDRLPLALIAATVAALFARPVADWIQETVTTSPEVDGVSIGPVKRQQRGSLVLHKIEMERA